MRNLPLHHIAFITAFIGVLLTPEALMAQSQKERTRLRMSYEKLASGERVLEFKLTSGSGRNMKGVPNAEISLYTMDEEEEQTELAIVILDSLGELRLFLDPGLTFPKDNRGTSTIVAEFDGSEDFRGSSSEIEIADVNIQLSFEEIDSEKYIKAKVYRLDADGEKQPVEDLSLLIGVDRLFSVLPIGKITTDEDGIGELEIPDDLPGDGQGMLTFVATIDEHDEFGTVHHSADYNWGIPVSYDVKPLPRQLFTDEAPLWMIFSVFIVLLGAWYHFFLSVSKLIRMKNAG